MSEDKYLGPGDLAARPTMVVRASVQCDNDDCDWFVELDGIPDMLDWYKMPCPECGHPDIIDEDEMLILTALSTIDEALGPLNQAMIEAGSPVGRVKLDSSDFPRDSTLKEKVKLIRKKFENPEPE